MTHKSPMKSTCGVGLILAWWLITAPNAWAVQWGQQAKLTADDGELGDHLGGSVSISGGTAIVGATGDDDRGVNAGSAYIFQQGGSGWTQAAKLVPDYGEQEGSFGWSVSISGETAVVGVNVDEDVHEESGWAYIFQQDESGWTQRAKLVPDDGAGGKMGYFGKSVSISGQTAIVGASHDDQQGGDSGSAYIFQQGDSGWTQVAKLLADDGQSGDTFGRSVAISGDTALVAASNSRFDSESDEQISSGWAYVFQETDSTWTQVAELAPEDARADLFFGSRVSISDGYAIVNADELDPSGVRFGSAYIFQESETGWSQVAKLLPADGQLSRYFGSSVSISGTTAIVGDHLDDDNGAASGAAYIFEDTGAGWTQVAKLLPDDGLQDDRFGKSVAISDGTAIIGATSHGDPSHAGAAYVFAVPEPSSMALLLAAGAALMIFTRYRRSRTSP